MPVRYFPAVAGNSVFLLRALRVVGRSAGRTWSQAPRCGARTRSGKSCQSPVVNGKNRCRMHGGAKGSGAPSGERNGNYRHGRFTAQAIRDRRIVREWIKAARIAAAEVE